jgi:MoaA/NifB/PqqE/SkfB family radical SAM enzyme
MEFSISNTCNLECVMCNGEWSSSIRSRREKLPPLKKVYGDGFFADLRKYLPHLRHVKILGGEPFLAQESFRIWDMMIEMGLQTPCHVTTNGTHYNAKVERVLDKLPFSFSISMDGVTKKTVESIRVNAVFEELRANFQRFLAYTRERGTDLTLTYCFMPQNYHELGDYLLFADEHECNVCVNTVIHPASHSLYQLPTAELRPIVEALDRQSAELLPRLGRNRDVWIHEVDRLRHRLQENDEAPLSFVPGRMAMTTGGGDLPVVTIDREELAREAARRLESWSGAEPQHGLFSNETDIVVDLWRNADTFLGIPKEQCIGRPMDDIYAQVRMRFGGMTGVLRKNDGPFVDRFFGLTSVDLQPRCLRMISFAAENPTCRDSTLTLAAVVDRPMNEVAR